MSISLIVSGIGAVVAAIGLGMLVTRCRRAPRGDLIAWSVALLGLFIALAAQTYGHLVGFSQGSFRAMEVGAEVIAPLALIMGVAELVAISLPGRFAARLFIPAFAFIPLVIFTADPLSGTAFTKAWPAPTVYYQIIPNKLLEYGLAPVSLLLALILVGIAGFRAGRSRAWRAVLPAAAVAGIAVVALVIPDLGPLGLTLPLSSLFALLCLAAAALAWYAGTCAARVPLAALHDGTADAGRAGARRAGRAGPGPGPGRGRGGRDGAYDDHDDDPDQGDWGRGVGWGDHTGDFESYDDGSQGVYRGGGLYRDEPAGARHAAGGDPGDDRGYGWQGNGDDYDSRELDAVYGPGGYDTGNLDAASLGSRDGYDRDGRPLDRDPLGSHPLGSDPLGSDPLGSDPLGSDPLGSGSLDRDPLGRGPLDTRAPLGNDPLDHGVLDHGVLDHGVLDHGVLDHGVLDHGTRDQGSGRADSTRAQLFGQIAIYTLIEDRVHEFDRLTERVVGKVRASEPDTLVYIVHAVPSAPMQRILYEVYRDRSAYDRHQQQPYVTEFEADRQPYVLATNVIELGLQQAKVSPFPSITDLFGEPSYDTSGFERPDYTREYGSSAGQNGTAR